ncbi:MAG TPA: enoyl-CoA hydratase-related protein [Terracidiphilus sp.]|nr:enoyl-CoA hydratase-related protein [Terracidiphilus sp.]
MELNNIRVEKRPPLGFVTLDRPEVRNALNGETFVELSSAISELGSDNSVRVILLAGAGDRAFAAGADIRELAALTPEEGRAFALRGQSLLRAIEHLGKPVIACIHGFALGGGCELAMACTLRLAADDARLGQPEVKLGIVAGYGGTQRLPRLVGRGMGLKLLLTGAIIDAQEAFRIGLVDEVVPAARLMERAEALALEIAANAPLAVAETLHAVDEGIDLPLDLALLREAARFGHLCGSADMAEGVRAFLAKRAPVWGNE